MILRGKILIILLMLCFAFKTNFYAQNSSNQSIEMIQPKFLKAGDTLAIVAPSGILKNRQSEVNQAIDLLKGWGLHVVIGKNVFSKDDHFAGTDEQRCEDLQGAMDDPKISAIWCARGGYGTVRILDKLDYTKF